MDNKHALEAFAALSQETRLAALRILVEHGRTGIAAGSLSKKLGIPHNTLSFHLAHLERAGLIASQKQGRSITYYAQLDTVQALVRFLLEDCCAVDKSTCKGIEKLLRTCAC